VKQAHNNALKDNFLQSLEKGFKSMGWSIAHCALDSIVILNKEHCKFKMSTLIIAKIDVYVVPRVLG
jgi:hypothetical protein